MWSLNSSTGSYSSLGEEESSLGEEEDASGSLEEDTERNYCRIRTFFYSILLLSWFVLLYYHAFAALVSSPALIYSTCADTLFDLSGKMPAGSREYTLRCPPRCSDFWVGNASAYGVFGGNGTYRGDSKLCRSGLHGGYLSDDTGGCFRVNVLGGAASFFGGGKRFGVTSFPADFYPWSLSISPSTAPHCASQQWPLLALLVAGALFASALLAPWEVFCVTCTTSFIYLSFTARGSSPVDTLVMGSGWLIALGGLCYAVWRGAGRVALEYLLLSPTAVGRTATLQSVLAFALLYLSPFLAALHMHLATSFIADVDLSTESLERNGGVGVAFLVAVVSVGALVVLVQGMTVRASGSWAVWSTVGGYAAMVSGYLALTLPLLAQGWASVHIHHLILALTLLPLTGYATRPSLIIQAALLGCLLNGVAFWGIAGPWDAALTPPPPSCKLLSHGCPCP